MSRFATEEWVNAYRDVINSIAEYKAAAKDWEGDVTIVVEPDPDAGVDSEIWGWFDLWHGTCRDAKLVTPDVGARATYVIRAPYSDWKDVVRGRLDPGKAMLQGKLKLKGDLHSLTQNVEAANALVAAAQQVPTEFPDD